PANPIWTTELHRQTVDEYYFQDRNAITSKHKLWPKGRIPYVIDKTISNLLPLINKAIEHYSNNTCISFVPRSKETDYVNLTKSGGCWSSVGRQKGQQIVSLDRGCGYLGTIIHEMMHAVGFWHEQNRPDRDDYVTINYNNILPGQEHNFIKFKIKSVNLLNAEYDYKSVMHYGEYSFSKDGKKPTIIAKQKGQRIGDVWEKTELSQTIATIASVCNSGSFAPFINWVYLHFADITTLPNTNLVTLQLT
uniref:Metalloendopeptidase n=1 Tax=Strigamia maritima TaxID=126957 RepID=T1JD61_STRMM